MKEFPWNNFSFSVLSNNSELYNELLTKLNSFKNREDIQVLKDSFRVFCRESLTADYLAFKLVGDNIPSLLFEINPYRTIPKQFLQQAIPQGKLISDLSCILLIEKILQKNNTKKNSNPNNRVLRQLATDIFKFWKDSLISFSIGEEKIPSNIKEEYHQVIREFIKKKGDKCIEAEYLYDACVSGKSQFISKEEAQERFGEEIILYGITEVDPLHLKILEILSNYIKISFLIPLPMLPIIHKGIEKIQNVKLKELLHERHILTYALGDKILSQVESLHQSLKEIKINEKSLRFYESQESYREIEFIGNDILRLIEKNQSNPNFRLTSIKLILPTDDINYAILVSNVFDRMKIPFSFTKDIRKKKTPYFSAVVSLLKLSISDFDKESIFSLFYNPCFFPAIQEIREDINPDAWNQIIARMNLFGFLDKQHRKKEGLRESNLMTWESLWNRLDSILINQETEITLEPELEKEVYQFLEISSSLLQDLIGLKDDFSSLKDFSRFFRIILDTYLSPSMRKKPPQDAERLIQLNQRGQGKVNSLLSSLEMVEDELRAVKADNIHFALEDFVEMLLEQMESWTEGDARVLKNGVVVGEMLDAVDPVFQHVYLAGLDERRFGSYSAKQEFLMTEDIVQTSRKNSSIKIKNYFAHIFHHDAKEYFFSYVNLDTIKDREFYPALELEWIRKEYGNNKKYKKIPLFSFLEYRDADELGFDKDTFNLINLKQKESSLTFLKMAYPDWREEEENLQSEISIIAKDALLKNKIKSYFFKTYSSIGVSKELLQNQTISVSQFIKYIECPKKFFFDYTIQTEEEEDAVGEVDSIDSLRWHTYAKEAFHTLLEHPSITPEQLTERILNPKRIEFGEVPYGVLGKVAAIDLQNYLEQLTAFYLEQKSNYKIFGRTIFNSNATQSGKSILFPTLNFGDKSFIANVDLMLLDGDNLYLTNIVTGKEIKRIQMLTVGYTAFAVNQSNVKLEIEKFLKTKINIHPAIMHMNRKSKLVIKLGNIENYSEELFEPFWKAFLSDQYPPSPFEEVNQNFCDYCNVKTICHGYHTDFVPFLSDSIAELKKLIVSREKNKS